VITEKVTFYYWRLDTWPWSLDSVAGKLKGAGLHSLTVPLSETYVKDGKRYYNMTVGYGDVSVLLVGDG